MKKLFLILFFVSFSVASFGQSINNLNQSFIVKNWYECTLVRNTHSLVKNEDGDINCGSGIKTNIVYTNNKFIINMKYKGNSSSEDFDNTTVEMQNINYVNNGIRYTKRYVVKIFTKNGNGEDCMYFDTNNAQTSAIFYQIVKFIH